MKEIIVAVLTAGAVFSFVQFIITFAFSRVDKHKDTEKKLDDIDKKIDEKFENLDNKIDENAAILARTHILRFSDEISNGIKHSSEYWRQQLDDCDTYARFCETHPNFKNSYTEHADKYIKDTYDQLKREGKL